MTWPAIKKFFTIPELKEYLSDIQFTTFKPSLIVWHNTALPTIQQWDRSAKDDLSKGLVPGITRINNLENYFKSQGWPSGPHFFVWANGIWVFTPPNQKGTHSPSWNGIAIGIEMIADFSKEDDDSGLGLQIKNNIIALTAMLCEKLGLDPDSAIKLHKEDKRTTHDCPGHDIAVDKDAMVDSVLEYMGHGGEHIGDKELVSAKPRLGVVKVPDFLNLRENSSASSKVISTLPPAIKVTILNEVMNGNTKWFYISVAEYKGWVSAKFIKEG